jgi:hypothetical protein
MKKAMKILSLILSSILLFVGCAPKEKQESNHAINDSVLSSASVPAAPQLAQPSVNPSVFESFIELFSAPGTEIPTDILTSLSMNNEFGRYSTKEILERGSITFVLFNHFKQVGPGIEELYAATFSKEGTLIEETLLGSSYPSSGPDGGGEDYNYRYDAKRKILYVTNSTIVWDEGTQEEVTKEVAHSFQLASDGKLVDPGESSEKSEREYPEVSERLLEKGELATRTKEELMIMRNEPFAAYGYIFKNKFLKDYFSSKAWYDPQFDNVNERLSEIEKVNIRLIKEVEDAK